MLLIVDEAQTGLGRCGSWFDSSREGVVPEFLTLSKTLGGGIPLSATLTTDAIEADCVGKGLAHNTSHVADPLPAAAGVAGLDVIADDGLVERAAVLRRPPAARGCAGSPIATRPSATCAAAACWPGIELVARPHDARAGRGPRGAVGAEAMTLGLSLHPIPTGPSAHCFRIAPPLTATDGRDRPRRRPAGRGARPPPLILKRGARRLPMRALPPGRSNHGGTPTARPRDRAGGRGGMLATGGGLAIASKSSKTIPIGADGTITACARRVTAGCGMVAKARTATKHEQVVTWNQKGQAGGRCRARRSVVVGTLALGARRHGHPSTRSRSAPATRRPSRAAAAPVPARSRWPTSRS